MNPFSPVMNPNKLINPIAISKPPMISFFNSGDKCSICRELDFFPEERRFDEAARELRDFADRE
jgi:hypothetical protein